LLLLLLVFLQSPRLTTLPLFVFLLLLYTPFGLTQGHQRKRKSKIKKNYFYLLTLPPFSRIPHVCISAALHWGCGSRLFLDAAFAEPTVGCNFWPSDQIGFIIFCSSFL
jgi:hypothetical protein